MSSPSFTNIAGSSSPPPARSAGLNLRAVILGNVWLRRVIGFAITIAIFVWISKPIVRNWDSFKAHVYAMSWGKLLLASAMFSTFLFVFRAMTWRRILIGFGHRIPIAPATRIWATSEMARYLPGVIWQVVGRAYLVKPYGVGGAVCSTSQVLELVIFLLANVLVAITCLLWNGTKHLQGSAREWMFCAMALVPILLLLLHPKVFYGMMNAILRRRGKPELEQSLGFATLAGLLLWNVMGLIWQSLAIWILTAESLGLQFTKWWVVAGAYSLAWCAGFLAVWAPGGIGVRELVFVTAMEFVVPARVRHYFGDSAGAGVVSPALLGFLAFLSVLLRLWATSGELLLSAVAYALDWKGASGRANAPGRVSRLAVDPSRSDAAMSETDRPS